MIFVQFSFNALTILLLFFKDRVSIILVLPCAGFLIQECLDISTGKQDRNTKQENHILE